MLLMLLLRLNGICELALELLKMLERPDVKLCAPVLFKFEFANAIRKYLVRGILNREIADEILAEIGKIPIEYKVMTWENVEEAFNYAVKKNITVYDAIYVILAKKLAGKFVTADTKLCSSLSDESNVILITDISREL